MFFGAPYAVFPPIAARLGGPAVLGLLYAAPGFGSLLISATSGWTRHVHRHGRAIALAVCGWGLAIAAFGFAPDLLLAVLALAAAGGADMSQRPVPDDDVEPDAFRPGCAVAWPGWR